MRSLAGLSLALFCAAPLGAGCGGKESPIRDETQALLGDGDDVTAVELDAQDLGTNVVGADGSSVAPSAARFPASCMSVEKTAATETLHFRECGSPAVTGDVVVRWELRALALHVELEAHAVFVGTTFFRDALVAADVSSSGDQRTMLWTSHFEGTLATDTRARHFVRDTTRTLRWTVGAPCVTVDGSSTGTVGERSVRVAVSGFRLCGGLRCPAENSHVRVENLVSGRFIDVRFAAQGHAVLRDTRGLLVPIRPACAG